MLQQIAPSNCIGFYKFSKLYALKRLQNGARASMLQKFSEVVRYVFHIYFLHNLNLTLEELSKAFGQLLSVLEFV